MNNKYLHFTVEEFIADEAFQQWVREPSGETAELWQKWLLDNPDKRREVHEATVFINHLSISAQYPSDQKIDASLAKTLNQIDELESAGAVSRIARVNRRTKHLALAAISILFISLTYFFIYTSAHKVSVQEFTAENNIRTIVLPDSTEIVLNRKSSIKYSPDVANITTREVWLDGEAYFNVRHVEKSGIAKKFFVHVNEMTIEVLGTTFNIKKRDDVYNVSLNTGKLNVRLQNDANTLVTLAPGDFLQYSTIHKNIIRKKVKSELYSDWKREKMELDNTSLAEVAALIHDIYGYNIIIKDKALEQEKISGTILLKDEETMFEALSFALGVKIHKNNNNLFFETKK